MDDQCSYWTVKHRIIVLSSCSSRWQCVTPSLVVPSEGYSSSIVNLNLKTDTNPCLPLSMSLQILLMPSNWPMDRSNKCLGALFGLPSGKVESLHWVLANRGSSYQHQDAHPCNAGNSRSECDLRCMPIWSQVDGVKVVCSFERKHIVVGSHSRSIEQCTDTVTV